MPSPSLYRLSGFGIVDDALGYTAHLYGSDPIAVHSEYIVDGGVAWQAPDRAVPPGLRRAYEVS